ncbi:hypothetical protein DICPUDRAFT_159660 [Dictyostelium purpureum]|uniref:Transmembrane protein n=1 Tax=Dictyostelium purpureum TaxID=5786 RepID=F1A4N5_DICPU|nr:uncharacterized protein DICPUDRAFT_159660 [Dictyostelium purpureum]EGC28842.1 hypothetical protein DICPUDRAFT_159660 [Dictyostelium purpureum]|eukprot:XP_003294628.1 hypothetical protein DICPUDRAFT_159660 [Dictyostelium purpureum]
MVKKSAMCSFVLILIAIGFSIAALSTYWYSIRIGDKDSVHSMAYYKYDKVKTSSKNGDDTLFSIYGKLPEDSKEKKIYQSSLAFTALAFIVLVVAAFLVLLSAIGLLKKIPCIGTILNILGKFILIAGTAFCFLAVFIFLGLQGARKDDCEDGVLGAVACDNGLFDSFNKNEDGYATTPYLGWSFMVIASALTIAATVINIIGGIF